MALRPSALGRVRAASCSDPGKLRRVQLPVPGRTYRVDDATDYEHLIPTPKARPTPMLSKATPKAAPKPAPKEMPNPNPKPTPIPRVLRSEFMART